MSSTLQAAGLLLLTRWIRVLRNRMGAFWSSSSFSSARADILATSVTWLMLLYCTERV